MSQLIVPSLICIPTLKSNTLTTTFSTSLTFTTYFNPKISVKPAYNGLLTFSIIIILVGIVPSEPVNM